MIKARTRTHNYLPIQLKPSNNNPTEPPTLSLLHLYDWVHPGLNCSWNTFWLSHHDKTTPVQLDQQLHHVLSSFEVLYFNRTFPFITYLSKILFDTHPNTDNFSKTPSHVTTFAETHLVSFYHSSLSDWHFQLSLDIPVHPLISPGYLLFHHPSITHTTTHNSTLWSYCQLAYPLTNYSLQQCVCVHTFLPCNSTKCMENSSTIVIIEINEICTVAQY